MIEKLKELEQEAMDYVTPEGYEEIQSKILGGYEQEVYQSGYIDGLQTAIRIMSEDDSSMSYSIELEDIFDDDEETNED